VRHRGGLGEIVATIPDFLAIDLESRCLAFRQNGNSAGEPGLVLILVSSDRDLRSLG
jgi:hypothetical protein